jgi:sugar lactone lactonase YvrE
MPQTNPSWRRQRLHGCMLWCVLLAACGDQDEVKPVDDEGKPIEQARVPEIHVAANDPMIRGPLDATPSPNGGRVYYTAASYASGDPQPGVFTVAADGGEPQALAVGDPLIAPAGISISLSGDTLYVADPAASSVFTLPASGGTPSELAGTAGYAPAGLVVAEVGDEYLYFTGRDPASGEAGLFRVAASGGAVETLASGSPLRDPSGVAVGVRGEAYVVETGGEAISAQVVRVSGGRAKIFLAGIGVGFPAGVTLTKDAKTLLVSGIDPDTRRDVVYFADTSSGKVTRLTETVGAFAEAAGLHRAHDADVFAWADSEANESGTVYVLEP